MSANNVLVRAGEDEILMIHAFIDGWERASKTMRVLVGPGLGGSSFTTRDVPGAVARLGEPTWGPSGLMRDLELRLGMHAITAPPSARVPAWAARIASLDDASAFYRESFRVDAIGTANTLLSWRDALFDAGWDGQKLANASNRLDALCALEAHNAEPLPAGRADRLVAIETAVRAFRSRIYDHVELTEARVLWPQRWQRLFTLLEARGTTISVAELILAEAPATSDLGVLQGLMRGAKSESAPTIRGDGSLMLLRGETPTELAALTAAMFDTSLNPATSLVVRCMDAVPLETALARHGLASQGHESASMWRPALQVLPLALELAFEPRNPSRILELLTLPVGPFQGRLGRELARAVAIQPGVGGQEWTRRRSTTLESMRTSFVETRRKETPAESEAKTEKAADAYITDREERIVAWLETAGAASAAPRSDLLAMANRVRAWLQTRIAAGEIETYGAAYSQASAFHEAVTNDRRDALTRDEARHVLDNVARMEHPHEVFAEQAGRIAHVDHPAALLATVGAVVVWGCVSGTERRPVLPPWNASERAALEQSGITFPDPNAQLAAEANAWRRCILAARERLVLVVPRTVLGAAMSPHSLWDEIRARLMLDDPAVARLTHEANDLVRGANTLVRIETTAALALPDASGIWQIDPQLLCDGNEERGTSATSLQTLASCPLSWVLEQRAKLRAGALEKIARGPLLNGRLSHRLVEELHGEGAFELEESAFLERTKARLNELIRAEASTLLLPGATFERVQLERQILRAIRELHRYLRSSGFRIGGVEERVETESPMGMLYGRLDMRLVDANGKDAVLDLKWGASTYRQLIANGEAIQLAAYSRAVARGKNRNSLPPAGYFALSSAEIITSDPRMKAPTSTEGASLDDTWKRIEATALAVAKSLDAGRIPVANTRRALPLLEALQVPEDRRDAHYQSKREAPCTYCSFPDICGRSWEGFR